MTTYVCPTYISHKINPNLKVLSMVALCIHVYLTYSTRKSHGLCAVSCYIICCLPVCAVAFAIIL
jgi:energy-coupling factor transporter transmembrane protein EcfT